MDIVKGIHLYFEKYLNPIGTIVYVILRIKELIKTMEAFVESYLELKGMNFGFIPLLSWVEYSVPSVTNTTITI